MSRIGKAPITVPPGVEVNIANGMVTISGKLGTLTQAIVGGITVSQEENVIWSTGHLTVERTVPCTV